jgi:putative acetyltransferase
MPIRFVSGDLFDNSYDAQAFAHGCNCQGSMGAGIARTFRARYPEMYEGYRRRCKAEPRQFNLGDCWLWKSDARPWIFNLGTQEGYWRSRSSYEAIDTALRRMYEQADGEGITSIAMPRIGVGYGGLSWKKVRAIIESVFGDEPIEHLDRPESDGDHAAIREVNRLAYGGDDEPRLVDALRDGGYDRVSMVAEEDGQVVGHILFGELPIVTQGGTVEALSLAPLAVIPPRQGRGIGSILVREGLRACTEAGHRIVVVLGHPEFYPQFEFSAKLAERLRSPFSGPAFMGDRLGLGTEGERPHIRPDSVVALAHSCLPAESSSDGLIPGVRRALTVRSPGS